LSGATGELLRRAEALADGPLAERAADCDARAAFPVENYRDLHRAGLLALTIPRAERGAGADWPTYLDVLRVLSRGCGSTGNSLNMHATVLRFVGALASPALRREVFAAVVEEGALVASLTSEPQMSLRGGFQLATVLRRKGDRLIVRGTKHFCSIATAARWYHVMARDEEAEGVAAICTVLVPREAPGVEVHDDWDTLGMRATASNSVSFHDVEVDARREVGTGGALLRSGLVEAFTPGYAAIYTGIAEAIERCAIEYASTRRFEPEPRPIAHRAEVQRALGRIATRVAGARALLAAAAERADREPPAACAQIFQQAKLAATTAAREVAGLALDVCGGRGLSRRFPLERYLRDAQAGNLMQPSAEVSLLQIGRRALGLDPWGRDS
jgi:hypothetical protein